MRALAFLTVLCVACVEVEIGPRGCEAHMSYFPYGERQPCVELNAKAAYILAGDSVSVTATVRAGDPARLTVGQAGPDQVLELGPVHGLGGTSSFYVRARHVGSGMVRMQNSLGSFDLALEVVPPSIVRGVQITMVRDTVVNGLPLSATASIVSQLDSPVAASASWSIADPGIATISSTGVITAVRSGTTTITATIAGVSVSRQIVSVRTP